MNVSLASNFKQSYKSNLAFFSQLETNCRGADALTGPEDYLISSLKGSQAKSNKHIAQVSKYRVSWLQPFSAGEYVPFYSWPLDLIFHSWEQTIAPSFIPQAFHNRPPLLRLRWAVRVASVFPPFSKRTWLICVSLHLRRNKVGTAGNHA